MYVHEMAGGSKQHKSWVAKIIGEDVSYGFKRSFVNNHSYGIWHLDDGVYNVKDGSKDSQEFFVIKDNERRDIEKDDVLEELKAFK